MKNKVYTYEMRVFDRVQDRWKTFSHGVGTLSEMTEEARLLEEKHQDDPRHENFGAHPQYEVKRR